MFASCIIAPGSEVDGMQHQSDTLSLWEFCHASMVRDIDTMSSQENCQGVLNKELQEIYQL